MKLSTLTHQLPGMRALHSSTDLELGPITQDSRAITPQAVFVATRGQSTDGHRFIPQAIAQGAALIVAERDPLPSDAFHPPTAWLTVHDTNAALAHLTARRLGHPGQALQILATTGTNGKTTTTFLLASILRAAGLSFGMVSTVHAEIANQTIDTHFTTPPAPLLQSLFARARDEGATHMLIEASSHGLEQRRIDAFPVTIAGFTNLSRDHLDYHPDMDAYRQAKARLFTDLAQRAAICIDQPAGQAMYDAFLTASPGAPCLSFSTLGHPADLSAQTLESDLDGIRATIARPDGRRFTLTSPLIGRHNIENAILAFAMAELAGIDEATTLRALRTAPGAPGRLERVPAPRTAPACFVDYAHTPDALDNVLSALHPLVKRQQGRLIAVFGAGGDRDHGKRPEMGATAARWADHLIITSDNPRTEDPSQILDAIVAGLPPKTAFTRHLDRKAAIHAALEMATPKDVVLIAGKGHEKTQTIGHAAHPFDDVQVAQQVLEAQA